MFQAPASMFPNPRDYAFCETEADDRGTHWIGVAPKMERADWSRIIALLMHEIAHATLSRGGIPHSERDADAVAEAIFGCPIYYDDIDVQTVEGGKRPRPDYLPR